MLVDVKPFRRLPNITMATRFLVAMVIATVFLDIVMCQRIPQRSNDPTELQISDAEHHTGSKMLPDGVEIVSYLKQHVSSRYYFMMEEEKMPLEIVVTPCDSSITLNIFTQSLPPEGSATGSDDYDDDLFRQYNTLMRQSVSGSKPVKHFVGSNVMKYSVDNATVGIYVIEVTADDRDCSLRVSASTSLVSYLIYPELPRDARVTSRFIGKATVELSWKPSPSLWRHGQPIKYCIAVNRHRHFLTNCAARAFKEPFTAAPPDAGFRFAWQSEFAAVGKGSAEVITKGTGGEKLRKLETRLKSPKTSEIENENVVYKCIEGKTRATFYDVIGDNVTYYFDVFAVNSKTNASATYAGTQLVARNNGKTVRLKEGKLTSVHLKRSVVGRSFLYHLSRKSKELTIQIHPCSGQLNVSVHGERGAEIRSLSNISRLESIRIKDARPGQYVIRVVKEGRPRSVSFRIVASSDPALVPYPAFPKDFHLKTFDKLNTCTSITVAWMGTTRRQKYCLYARKYTSESSILPADDRCLGHTDRPKSQKLVCRYFRVINDKKSAMTEIVRRLKPRTTYVFTVYAVKQGGVSLPYENLIVKTKDFC